ncbi:MAG: glycosyltransferase family 4 protein [Ruminococcus sp.]|jgi:glycosyltransferase involved in cell wall biosynthesis
MKKVLMVTHVGDFIPQFEMDNVRCLQEMGYEVHYAANFSLSSYGKKGEKLKDSGVICHQIPFFRSPFQKGNIRAYRMLKQLLRRESFAMIHCHTPIGGAMARLAGRSYRKKGLKILYTAHGFHFFKGAPLVNWLIYYPAEWFLSWFTDVQITINGEDFERAGHFHAGKVVRIPGVGIDTEELGRRLLEDRDAFRASLGLKADDFCLLSVGELDANKNHETVLRALREMNCDHIRYLICGKGQLERELREKIREYGLEGKAELLGFRNDVPAIYEAADLFVFPSHREGLSAALMEAMAKGLPVVCSRIRGNVDLIEEEKGGLLVGSRSPSQFAGAIQRLLEDRVLCDRMGRRNRDYVRSFDKSRVRSVMEKVYHEVLP